MTLDSFSLGAMDVLEVDRGKDPWNPNEMTIERMHRWLKEAHRVLSPNGLLISISFAQPHFRRLLFDAKGYSWIVRDVPYTTELAADVEGIWQYFAYFARKGERPSQLRYERPDLNQDLTEEEKRGCKEELEHEYLDSEDFLFRIQGD